MTGITFPAVLEAYGEQRKRTMPEYQLVTRMTRIQQLTFYMRGHILKPLHKASTVTRLA